MRRAIDRTLLMTWPPQRIVCLSEETAETLYLLGEEARIVGVTVYASRPARIRDEKPTVGSFLAADMPGILALKPDLLLASSDMQAEISGHAIRAGIPVHCFQHGKVAGIFAMTACLGAITGRPDAARALTDGWARKIAALRAAPPDRAPRVWVEQWDEPLIAALDWVRELAVIAGGADVVSHLHATRSTRERIVTTQEIAATRPDLIVASWGGRRVRTSRIIDRPGWNLLPAVRRNMVLAVDGPLLLSPGPGALTEGLDLIRAAVLDAAARAEAETRSPGHAGG
jgi:iron complex transport system substrate-binding protein